MAIRDNLPGQSSGLLDPIEIRTMLGHKSLKSYYSIDVRQFSKVAGSIWFGHSSVKVYFIGATSLPTASSVTITSNNVTVSNKDSHEPVIYTPESGSLGPVTVDIDLSTYTCLVVAVTSYDAATGVTLTYS